MGKNRSKMAVFGGLLYEKNAVPIWGILVPFFEGSKNGQNMTETVQKIHTDELFHTAFILRKTAYLRAF